MTLRVLVADDHPMCRTAARIALTAIDPVVELVEVACLADALAAAGPFDLIVLDLNLPDSRGLLTLVDVTGKFPASSVLIISGSDDVGWGPEIAALGACGYVPKSAAIPDITTAIRTVLAGGRAFQVDSQLSTVNRSTDAVLRLATLTPAERRVLTAMASGGLNKQIAYELGLSEMTIKQHVRAILRKLKVVNRTKAVLVYCDAARHEMI